MHLGDAVELGHSSGFLEGSFEVSDFRVWEVSLVFGDQFLEGLGGCLELAVGFPGFQLFVGVVVQWMVLQASLFVDVSFQNGWAEVFVCGQDDEVRVVLQCLQESSIGGPKVVLAMAFTLLAFYLVTQGVSEGCQSFLQGFTGLWWIPVAFDVKLGVVVI